METTIQSKTCTHCQAPFDITDQDLAFYDRVSPAIDGKKYAFPAPTMCPACRRQRRLAYRNDRTLYKSICAMTGKPMISMYNTDYGYTVYEQGIWRSDERDPMSYGRTFDPSRSFFEQYYELMKQVPRFNLYNMDSENCDYVNYAPHCKNCYLLFGSRFSEDCYYGQTILGESKNCMDSLFLDGCEYCYENIDCTKNYNSFFCQNCIQCTNSYFCFDCENCTNCIGCYNLRNKDYHILNKPVSKEEFMAEKAKFSSHTKLMESKKFYEDHIRGNAIFRFYRGRQNENVSGDFIFQSKNIKDSFSIYESKDLAFCARMIGGKDSYDFDGGGKSELTCENMSNDFSYACIGCMTAERLKYCYYCDLCFDCEHCFGCIGLRKKQFCIFNTQYTKAEYEALVSQIIEKMMTDHERGQFLLSKYCPYGYNETMAYEYDPLTKEFALQRGYKRRDEEKKEYIIQTYIVPDDIVDVQDDILGQVLQCEITKKNFKIIPQELAFYRKMKLPIPRRHPDQRHLERMNKRTPRKLWERKCMKCGTDIQTTYSPDPDGSGASRPEIVRCEQCYNKEIY
jgi:hypothetical protein